MISKEMETAVRFYEGDVSGQDPFWGDPKAYCTLNSLFFPGLDTELARSAEGKRLNPSFLRRPQELLALCGQLFSAFDHFRTDAPVRTWRVERFLDYQKLSVAGATVSFTSTSLAGFLDSYRDRRGIVLMEFHLPAGCPCIPFGKALSSYHKASEEEILLPPWLSLTFSGRPLSPDEIRITDQDGRPPVLSCVAEAGAWKAAFPSMAVPGPTGINARCSAEDSPAGPGHPLFPEGFPNEEDAMAGTRVYEALNEGTAPDPADTAAYLRWKEGFRGICSNLVHPLLSTRD